MFREALKAGWYDLHKARDTYRSITAAEGPHADVTLRYAEVALSSCPHAAPAYTAITAFCCHGLAGVQHCASLQCHGQESARASCTAHCP